MKTLLGYVSIGFLLMAGPQTGSAWTSFLDGSSLPDAVGWVLDGAPGTKVVIGPGNGGFQQIDSQVGGYAEWYKLNVDQASTLGARFSVDNYGGGPANILQLSTANSAADPSPFLAVAIREGRFYLIRVFADSSGADLAVARLADLGPVEAGLFHEAYLYIDNATDGVQFFWDGGLRYAAVDTETGFLLGAGEGYAEFGASNYWPENDRSGIATVTFDWVGLGNAGDLPLALPFMPWDLYLDGSTSPATPWLLFTTPGEAGDTLILDFIDPLTGSANQAMQLSSGTGANEWYAGPFFEDEVFGGARFAVLDFFAEGKENLIGLTTRSEPKGPSASITMVDGRYKLWSYVDPDTAGSPGLELLDIGEVIPGDWHTVYLYARKDGLVKLWWDGELLYDDMAPLVNPFDGYFEWGSGTWQYDASDTVAFDWVAYGAQTPPSALTTTPADGAVFQDPAPGFSFTYASPNGVAANGFRISINGVDLTAGLVVTGDDKNRQGHLGGLLANQLYRVLLDITESNGRMLSFTIVFDTFTQANFMFEAEDWNFEAGLFIDDPILSSVATLDSYFGTLGIEDVDQDELSTDPAASGHEYRSTVLVGTEPTDDFLRQKFVDAQVTDPAVTDYNVGWVDVGEWLNYTRTFPAGVYYLYGRFGNGNIGQFFEAAVDKVTGPNDITQITTPVGAFRGGPGEGWQTFRWVPLNDSQGRQVVFRLAGEETLRVTCVAGGYNANFYMLVPAPPTLRIDRINNSLVVSWVGDGVRLQSGPTVRGPWVTVPNQTNPLTIVPTGNSLFYRLSP